MNVFTKIGCRLYQRVYYVAEFFVNWYQADTLKGENSLDKLPEWMKEHGRKSALLVTDSFLSQKMGLSARLSEGLAKQGIKCTVYDGVVPNPTIDCIEEGVTLYKNNACDCIIALGGGSPMDCAKGIGARIACPKKQIAQMKGNLKVHRKLPPLYAIPTTAGTGSEVTLAAVISNPAKQEKYPINDPVLIPRYIVFDPVLTVGLPQSITSTTGMDALTHAVESFIGQSNTKQTKKDAIEATQLIFKYLKRAYDNGNDIEARENMQIAAYLAGKAFTRAYVGYVHAIAHTLGGFYGVPHGLANSILLPHVLKKYGKSAHKKLAKLADAVGIGGATVAEKANNFISAIEQMNKDMNIPTVVSGKWTIKDEDIDRMVDHAYSEGNPLYPVPKLFGKKELKELILEIKG